MPSRSNPNTPSSSKPRHVSALKAKRKTIQRATAKLSTPRTSQAIRTSAPLSRKKAKKLERKIGYARRRALEEALEVGEVVMKDADSDGMKGQQQAGEATENGQQGRT